VAGSSTALVRKALENSRMQAGGLWFKKLAGVTIGLLGMFFIVRPFFEL
jgi:cytochrome c-type biogenesis protein